MQTTEPCSCGSGAPFANCCQPVIDHDDAASAQALMRSRYTAYVRGCWDYLHQSWHPDTRPSHVSPTDTDWLGLSIIKVTDTTVEFIAGFREQGKIMALHEISYFVQVGKHWRYVDGQCEVSEAGRNTVCPCGSGKKTKRCCGKGSI